MDPVEQREADRQDCGPNVADDFVQVRPVLAHEPDVRSIVAIPPDYTHQTLAVD
jgi:hypothetical protein